MILNYEPKYMQIANEIKKSIDMGLIDKDQRILSENEIRKKYKVSSTTARKSIDTLKQLGLIESIQGKGTYIRDRKSIDRNLEKILSFTRIMERVNRKASGVILEKKLITEYGIYHKRLELDENDNILKLKRLRYGDGIPYMLDCRYINIKKCPNIEDKDLSNSLYAIYEEYGIKLLRAVQTLQMAYLSEENAKLLHVKTSDPAFLLIGITYSADNKPIEYEESYYNAQEYKFIVEAYI
jgi:GntR family transcriptional regulator